LLQSLLGDLDELQPSPILMLRPGSSGGIIIRARRASSLEEAMRFCNKAVREVGPPPREKAIAGRMNAYGIPVFYGAFSEKVAIAEVRPSVGGLVVVGQFAIITPLRVLDLTQYSDEPSQNGMFASSYVRRVTQYRFLRKFLDEISRAIQPHEEPLEYVPTQAVAEYLADGLHLDGIIYPSAQLGGIEDNDDLVQGDAERDEFGSSNIALFDAAGIIRNGRRRSRSGPINIPEEPTMDDLWKLQDDLFQPRDPERKPALRYIKGGANIVQVTRIDVSYSTR
jgi:hypothetical protein